MSRTNCCGLSSFGGCVGGLGRTEFACRAKMLAIATMEAKVATRSLMFDRSSSFLLDAHVRGIVPKRKKGADSIFLRSGWDAHVKWPPEFLIMSGCLFLSIRSKLYGSLAADDCGRQERRSRQAAIRKGQR